MNELTQMTKTINWLEAKFINREGGIIFESHPRRSFDAIQNFIENYELPFQTPIIYYQAFPEESTLSFIDTLREELVSKLANSPVYRRKNLLGIIKDAGLKMVVIDDCHVCPEENLEKLLDFFSNCQVSVILVGNPQEMAESKILDHPLVNQQNNFNPNLTIQI